MNSAAIRALLAGHQPHATRRAVELLLGEMEKLQETMNNQYQRQGNQIADLRKEIDRLKGVHGA